MGKVPVQAVQLVQFSIGASTEPDFRECCVAYHDVWQALRASYHRHGDGLRALGGRSPSLCEAHRASHLTAQLWRALTSADFRECCVAYRDVWQALRASSRLWQPLTSANRSPRGFGLNASALNCEGRIGGCRRCGNSRPHQECRYGQSPGIRPSNHQTWWPSPQAS